jgi:hypothetical protein
VLRLIVEKFFREVLRAVQEELTETSFHLRFMEAKDTPEVEVSSMLMLQDIS